MGSFSSCGQLVCSHLVNFILSGLRFLLSWPLFYCQWLHFCFMVGLFYFIFNGTMVKQVASDPTDQIVVFWLPGYWVLLWLARNCIMCLRCTHRYSTGSLILIRLTAGSQDPKAAWCGRVCLTLLRLGMRFSIACILMLLFTDLLGLTNVTTQSTALIQQTSRLPSSSL